MKNAMTRQTPLRSDPEKTRAWQRRSKPLRKRGKKATDPTLVTFRQAVHARQWCELGPPACEPERHEGHHAHHAHRKSQGGTNEPANGLLCCSQGHLFIHDNPAVSFERGWLRRTSWA